MNKRESVWVFEYGSGWGTVSVAVVAATYEEAGRKFIANARPDSMTGEQALNGSVTRVSRYDLGGNPAVEKYLE